MVGFPYYNEYNENNELYLSDYVVDNGKYFMLGFILALITTPSVVFADEIAHIPGEVPTPAPTPGTPVPGGNVPTDTRNAIQSLLAAAGCGAAVTTCSEAYNQAVKSAADKMSTTNPSTALAVGGCIFLVGYCAGKLTTKAVDKALGFN